MTHYYKIVPLFFRDWVKCFAQILIVGHTGCLHTKESDLGLAFAVAVQVKLALDITSNPRNSTNHTLNHALMPCAQLNFSHSLPKETTNKLWICIIPQHTCGCATLSKQVDFNVPSDTATLYHCTYVCNSIIFIHCDLTPLETNCNTCRITLVHMALYTHDKFVTAWVLTLCNPTPTFQISAINSVTESLQ